jgi:hypothetical protein
MSTLVRFVKPTTELIEFVAANMRVDDRIEVYASHGHTPIEALTNGVSRSKLCSVALINDEPCAVFGLVVENILTGFGVPWLLGTDLIFKHRRVFIEHTRSGVDEMLQLCPRLSNWVHCDNIKSIRWLSSMGFSFSEPLPTGINGEMFMQFSRGI